LGILWMFLAGLINLVAIVGKVHTVYFSKGCERLPENLILISDFRVVPEPSRALQLTFNSDLFGFNIKHRPLVISYCLKILNILICIDD